MTYINIVDSAFYLTTKEFRLRDTQILSILIFLNTKDSQKTLLEILTGEGKTTTVSCIAAIMTISGFKVDIVTSNPHLAKRDME